MFNKTCKNCNKEYHTCHSCAEYSWEYDYCSEYCWETSKEYNNFKNDYLRLYSKLDDEDKKVILGIIDNYEDYQYLFEEWSKELDNNTDIPNTSYLLDGDI